MLPMRHLNFILLEKTFQPIRETGIEPFVAGVVASEWDFNGWIDKLGDGQALIFASGSGEGFALFRHNHLHIVTALLQGTRQIKAAPTASAALGREYVTQYGNVQGVVHFRL